MANYIQTRKNLLQSRLTRIQTTLAKLYATMDEQSATGNESYSFDSGEGSQRTTRRKISDLSNEIERLEATQDHIINELHGMGVVSIQNRRTAPSCFNR